MPKNNRIKNLIFHIKSDDYLGTLATVLDLLRQTAGKKETMLNNDEFLKGIVDDLMYLQTNYKIEKK